MTKANNLDVSKKLSLESKHLLDELGMISTKAADLIPRLYESLKHDGLGPSEIREFIESKISIGDRRLRQLLPAEAKRTYPIRKKLPISNVQPNRRLVVPEEPVIPPPPAVVREAEIVRQPPKPLNEPISIPKYIDIIFVPSAIDMMDTSQAFIIQYDIIANKVKRYRTVGRRTVT